MKITVRRVGLALYILFFSPSFSQAETETAVTTGASPGETRAKFFDRLSVEYSNTFVGPSLANPISNTHFDDETGDRTGLLELENTLLTGFRLSSDLTLGAVTK